MVSPAWRAASCSRIRSPFSLRSKGTSFSKRRSTPLWLAGMSTRIATWRPMKAFLSAVSFWARAGRLRPRRARETGRRDIFIILSFYEGSVAEGGPEVQARGRVVGRDDLRLAVLGGDVLVHPGLAPDQLGEAHALEGNVALGKREGG